MSPFHKSHAVETYYEDHGNTDSYPIVLIHPIGGNILIWRDEIPLFLKGGFRVIAYEIRGHYRTDMGKAKAYAIQDLAEDLHSLLGHLKIKRCTLVGHSIGGIIASIYAAKYPENVDVLVLMNSSPKRFRDEDLEKHFETRDIALSRGIEALVEHMLKAAGTSDLWKDRERANFFREFARKTSVDGFVAATVALYSIPEDLVHRLRATNCRILAIVGSDDKVFMRLLKETKEDVPELELRVLEGCDHWEVIERPEELYHTLTQFLLENQVVEA
jgi:3-oxoadipate enol-lactonase